MVRWCGVWVTLGLVAGGCSAQDPYEPGTPLTPTAPGVGTSADGDPTSGSGGGPDSEATSGASEDPSGAVSSGGDETTGDPDATGASDTGVEDNCYSEPLDPSADVSDIVQSYGGPGYQQAVIEAMRRRYPAGADLLEAQQDDPYWAQFSDSNSWQGMVEWLDTLVHEQTHLFNAYHAIDVGQSASIYMRQDLIVYLPPEQGFARGEILAELPAVMQQSIYADTYLTGSQGQRGFGPLLDETSAYVNEVPGLAVFGEYYPGFGLSLRDGAAAMLVFVEFYLRRARTQYPGFYAWAQSQPAYVEAVQLLWQRAQFFYEEVGDHHPNLGISDAEYRAEAEREENLDELRMFTGVGLQAGPCVD
ncbi:MAG: hypothetical protein ACE37F_12170 [Nannocystaceae bacterium]|nr:hypothetical protein [bacterium]